MFMSSPQRARPRPHGSSSSGSGSFSYPPGFPSFILILTIIAILSGVALRQSAPMRSPLTIPKLGTSSSASFNQPNITTPQPSAIPGTSFPLPFSSPYDNPGVIFFPSSAFADTNGTLPFPSSATTDHPRGIFPSSNQPKVWPDSTLPTAQHPAPGPDTATSTSAKHQPPDISSTSSSASTDQLRGWPNNIMPVLIADEFSAFERETIKLAMKQVSSLSGLRVVERVDELNFVTLEKAECLKKRPFTLLGSIKSFRPRDQPFDFTFKFKCWMDCALFAIVLMHAAIPFYDDTVFIPYIDLLQRLYLGRGQEVETDSPRCALLQSWLPSLMSETCTPTRLAQRVKRQN